MWAQQPFRQRSAGGQKDGPRASPLEPLVVPDAAQRQRGWCRHKRLALLAFVAGCNAQAPRVRGCQGVTAAGIISRLAADVVTVAAVVVVVVAAVVVVCGFVLAAAAAAAAVVAVDVIAIVRFLPK